MPLVKYRSRSIAPAYRSALHRPDPSLRLPDEGDGAAAAYRSRIDETDARRQLRLNPRHVVDHPGWITGPKRLMAETFDKNMSRQGTSTRLLHCHPDRVAVAMVADLFHAENLRDDDRPAPSALPRSGQSEAVMLAGLALKWGAKQLSRDNPDTRSPGTPNLRWAQRPGGAEEFRQVLRGGARYLPMAGPLRHHSRAGGRRRRRGHHRGGRILGTTHRWWSRSPGCPRSVQTRRRRVSTSRCTSIPPAVASSRSNPDPQWDFRVPRVVSINVSEPAQWHADLSGMGFVVGGALNICPEPDLRVSIISAVTCRPSAELLPAWQSGRRSACTILPARASRLHHVITPCRARPRGSRPVDRNSAISMSSPTAPESRGRLQTVSVTSATPSSMSAAFGPTAGGCRRTRCRRRRGHLSAACRCARGFPPIWRARCGDLPPCSHLDAISPEGHLRRNSCALIVREEQSRARGSFGVTAPGCWRGRTDGPSEPPGCVVRY